MKIYYVFIMALALLACTENEKRKRKDNDFFQEELGRLNEIVKADFQEIIDSANVTGTILIYDSQKDIYYSNDFEWAKIGRLPASTFKIVNSIIGIESGVIAHDSVIFKWDGQEKFLKSWEQDLVLKDAFHFSCVPCYQEVARDIGFEKMNKYLLKLGYGNMTVDSSNIDNFWLEGDARISPFQQINFLQNFYESKLAVSPTTTSIMKRMMVIKSNDDFTLSGKTGWSVQNEINNGWYVGYVKKDKRLYYFATNIEPKAEFEMNKFSKTRKIITHKAMRKIEIIK